MKIFLIYPAINLPEWRGRIYSYGLGYIYAVLKQAHYSVDYIPLKNRKDILSLYEKVKIQQPDIIGFAITTNQFNYLKEIIKAIKEISHSFVVCGGKHPTFKPECISEISALDAIVRGEGEFAMLELAEAFKNKRGYSKIKNFWFKEKNKIVRNTLRPLIKNLDELPFPDKTCLDNQKAVDAVDCINGFIFSRGCTFECSYCSSKALNDLYLNQGSYFRQRSPQKAIEEIELNIAAIKKHKSGYIRLDDDTISLNRKWFYEFFTLYKKKIRYPLKCNLRPGTIDSDMVSLLKEAAGTVWVIMGVEHGNERFRKTILKRKITDKQIIDSFNLCANHGISCYAQVMVGLPFENKELFLDTVKLCRKLPLKAGHSSEIFTPYPGTPLARICEENNWLPDEKFYTERVKAVISYPNFTKEEIQLCHDILGFLINCKFIPLNIPLKWLASLSIFYRLVVHLQRMVLRIRFRSTLSF